MKAFGLPMPKGSEELRSSEMPIGTLGVYNSSVARRTTR